MPEEVKPPGAFSPGVASKKSVNQTLMSFLAVVGASLGTLLVDPAFMGKILDAVKDNPKLAVYVPVLFGLIRYGLAFWRDYQKHKDPSYYVEHGSTPAKAQDQAIASGADPAAAHEEAVDAAKDAVVQAGKEALGRWADRATERDAAKVAEPPPAPIPVVAKILKKILPKRKKKAKGK